MLLERWIWNPLDLNTLCTHNSHSFSSNRHRPRTGRSPSSLHELCTDNKHPARSVQAIKEVLEQAWHTNNKRRFWRHRRMVHYSGRRRDNSSLRLQARKVRLRHTQVGLDSRNRHSKTLYSKKYGVHLARFTHHSQNVIYASTKEDGIDHDSGAYLTARYVTIPFPSW